MFGVSEKNKPRQQGPAHTLISRQTEISGDVRFMGELIIEGTVRGNIFAEDESTALVRLAETGVVEGEICVPSAVINGLVRGDVHCAKHLELAAKAVVIGNVYYSLIEMVMGAEVNGNLMHIGRAQQESKRLAGASGKVLSYDTGNQTIVD